MNIRILKLFGAAFALVFVAAACASDTGAQWTFAPVSVADSSVSAEAETETITDVEAGDADPDELPAGEGDADPAATDETNGDEPRVIGVQEIEATGALQFTQDGEKLADIKVTPGETILFQIDNTAGFDHNFYIGSDAQLSVPSATTDDGIPDWSSGTQELEWTVPDDLDGLKFGCTVPGHYTLMQGIFSIADGPTEPVDPVEPVEAVESTAPAEGSAGTADARVIDIEATGALQFQQNGEKISDIPVTPGEIVIIRVNNTAGFDHNFYIGTDDQLMNPGGSTDVGIPTWNGGEQSVEWQVPADVTSLKFGCTVPGHYTLMQGTYSVSS